MNFILITKDHQIANHALSNGVDLIMVDLEYIGKKDRQSSFDTVLNSHTIEDVSLMSKKIDKKKLIVRINPINKNTSREIDNVLKYNPSYIMLPMFKNKKDLEFVLKIIDNRSKLIPLIENPTSFMKTIDYIDLNNIGFFYYGLNDINIGMGNNFLFEALAYDLLKPYFEILKENKLPFGFGGMAKMNEGELPGKYVFSEHVRHGSNYIILSRAFHKNATNINEFKSNVDLSTELKEILEYELFLNGNYKEVEHNHKELKRIVNKIVNNKIKSNYKK